MPFFNTEKRFSTITKTLHWLIAVLIFAQFSLIYYRETLPEGSEIASNLMALHKSFGTLLLLLSLAMLLSRHMGTRPVWPKSMPLRERILARSVHIGLYLSLLLMPITGYLMSTSAGYSVSFFGIWTIPNFVTKNVANARIFNEIHSVLGYYIIALVILHILGALKHHCIDKNNLLKRMLPFG